MMRQGKRQLDADAVIRHSNNASCATAITNKHGARPLSQACLLRAFQGFAINPVPFFTTLLPDVMLLSLTGYSILIIYSNTGHLFWSSYELCTTKTRRLLICSEPSREMNLWRENRTRE